MDVAYWILDFIAFQLRLLLYIVGLCTSRRHRRASQHRLARLHIGLSHTICAISNSVLFQTVGTPYLFAN